MFPNAAQGSADAKKLIFTNANSKTGRENVSARVSCDDGATWPGVRTIRSGFSAYSTVTRLDEGRFGVLYEGNYTDNMPFATFDDAWLNYACAPLSVPAVTTAPGATQQVAVTVTNQEATTLSGATATVYTPSGWSATTVPVPDVAPGASATVNVALTAPANASGPQNLNAAFTTADGRVSQFTFTATVPVAPQVGLTITGTAPARDVVASPYKAGDVLSYTLQRQEHGQRHGKRGTGFRELRRRVPAAVGPQLPVQQPGRRCELHLHHGQAHDDGARTSSAATSCRRRPSASRPARRRRSPKRWPFTGAAVALRDGLVSAEISGQPQRRRP